jgi:hypothetical protein
MIGRLATGMEDILVDLTLAERVPTLYAGVLSTWEGNRNSILVFAVVAVIFGAIHCIAWSSTFPSHLEQTLWHVSCVAIMGMPGIYFIIYAGAALFMDAIELMKVQQVLNIIIPPLLFVYFVCRIALFILAFMALRSLPPGAYDTIHWMTFVPHV